MIERALTIFILCLLAVLLLGTPARADTDDERIINCEKYKTDEVVSLACNIYHEARGEGEAGQWLVALATRNRVENKHYPNTYAEVVWEIRTDAKTGKRVAMFSWTLDGKPDWINNEKMWLSSLLIAARVVAESQGIVTRTPDFTYGCMWYHHVDVSPYWMDHYHPTVRIKKHQCYTTNEKVFLKKLSEMLPN